MNRESTVVNKWGNSYAIRIPKSIIKNKQLKIGDELIIKESSDKKRCLKFVKKGKKQIKRLEYFMNMLILIWSHLKRI